MFTTADIRRRFLDYFAHHGHTVVPSSPLVPRNDPSLLFVNAGMVPFKNLFIGAEKRDYTRATSAQKCFRTIDIENVGYTTRHHTFFEMLGNFSFGDYFKELAIELAWNLLTKEFGIPKEKLLITVYADDDEAAGYWKKIAGLSDDRIIRIATDDNFWSMGATGPCGPCSEIFYDHGEHIPGGPPGSPDEDGDRFIEIWNLVFMQYERLASGEQVPLPKPSIDTGMGIERIAAVLQNTHDNFQTDLFQALIHASAEATGVSPEGEHAVAHRVIADHLRSSSFVIADGVMPSNEGRGYVLRRIMRRAMRYAYLMGYKDPLMWQLVPTLIAKMGNDYPELVRAEALITEVLKLEEEKFIQTLGRGLKLLRDETSKLATDKTLPGDVAFKLYDTYGFPLDLTQDILRSEGKKVDTGGFDAAMATQREAARAAWSGSGEQAQEKLWFEIHERTGATEFLGYNCTESEGQIVALVKDGQEVQAATTGDEIEIITNQTPFYAESGGQVGDTGLIVSKDGAEIMVSDTISRPGNLSAHLGKVTKGKVRVGDGVSLTVNSDRRTMLRANHSATHLLHAALRKELGASVVQKGSLVAPNRLRFDFSFTRALTADELRRIEAEVNRQIRNNTQVTTHLMPPEEAQKAGAMALFGEKYGEEVRVVTMGKEKFSLELCGGTHVERTGDIGICKIVGESGISAGVRRIEALTGAAAETYSQTFEDQLVALATKLKSGIDQVPSRVESLIEERKKLKQELKKAKLTPTSNSEKVKEIAGTKFMCQNLQDVHPKELRPLADQLKQSIKSGIVMVTTINDDRVSLVVGVTADLTDKFNAVNLAQAASQILGGKGGGGRPDMAQAGGTEASKIEDAINAVENMLSG